MCGICFYLGADTESSTKLWENFCESIKSRGPDAQETITIKTQNDSITKIHASVLHMRGLDLQRQPFVSEEAYMIYNGEIFDGLDVSIEQNDGAQLFGLISKIGVVDAVEQVDGPYALVYIDRRTNRVTFTRDQLGRRSLVAHFPTKEEPYFALCSVIPKGLTGFVELNANEIHQINLDLDNLEHVRIQRSKKLSNILQTEDEENHDNGNMEQSIEALKQSMEKAIKARTVGIPGHNHHGSKVGVLFSGGIDCTVIALLIDKFLDGKEPIDLLNVAFENPRVIANKKKNNKKEGNGNNNREYGSEGEDDIFQVPDRITGKESANELVKLRPLRKWNFVEINIDYETCIKNKEHIIQLMKPSDTVMDLSIAQALHFAAKGQGIIKDQDGQIKEYNSDARVLFSGLGADEQLGGYSRHRRAFEEEGWQGLYKELCLDIGRIGTRNLGRDDRVISTHGKEVRYPYLAKNVMECITQIPLQNKCDPRKAEGEGDKQVLRLLAYKLGLNSPSKLKKRAIQFGARSAKMEIDSSRHKGHNLL